MRVLLLVALFFSVAGLISALTLGYENADQELRVFQHRVILVDKLLKLECPNYIAKREAATLSAIQTHLGVEKHLFNALVQRLIECRAKKAKKTQKPTSAIKTKPPTTTTTPPTTTLRTTTVPTTTVPTTTVPTTTVPTTTVPTTTVPTTTVPTTTVPTTTVPTTTVPTTTVPTTTVPTTTAITQFRDCQDAFEHGQRQSGVYELNLPTLPPFNVWCDFIGGKGYTVIQRHINYGNVSFNRDWAEYKKGFGDVKSEHWLGNDKIHALTTTNQKLNIKLVQKDGSPLSGDWSKFYVADEADNYRLTVEGAGLSGDTNHYFTGYHNKMAFSTKDRDNDLWSKNCAAAQKGGWWYKYCSYVDLNEEDPPGMHWWSYALRSSVMRVTRG